jgi:hypothetical protein
VPQTSATLTPVRPPAPRPSNVPPCTRLGRQCQSIPVTLRIGELEGGDPLDHEATWLLGHTERITFGEMWESEGDMFADAVIHVPCKYLRSDGTRATCGVYGYEGPAPRPRRVEQPRQLGGDRFRIVETGQTVTRRLPLPRRSLPVLSTPEPVAENPCATARCETADHRRGAACCRDLQVEIMCTRRERKLEALVRSRRSPYLCKVNRPGDYSIEAEIISACAYLEPGGVNCTLHGRERADGRSAKPTLCFEWPPKRKTLHPGCVFARRRR